MKLKFLGTGTAIPSLRRGSSACVLHAGDRTILIDAGPAVVRRLLEFGYTVDDVDILILTHFHVDHSADLSTFLFACNYGAVHREKPLTIIGGPGIHRFWRTLLSLYPWLEPKLYRLTVRSAPLGAFEEGGLLMEARKAKHNPESIGIRIDDGKAVAFTGDSDYSRSMVRLARDADLLVAECAFPERKVKGHMNLESLRKVVLEAKPKRVFLTHLYPDWDDFRGVLHAPVLMAEDGLEVTV